MRAVTTTIPNDTHEKLGNLAWIQKRSMNHVMREAIEQYIREHRQEIAWAEEFKKRREESCMKSKRSAGTGRETK